MITVPYFSLETLLFHFVKNYSKIPYISLTSWKTFFPECVAWVLVLHFGGLGVDTCSRDPAFGVRNRLQPSAHDRRETKVSVSMGKATKTCLSVRVRRCAYVVLRGRRGAL